MNFRECPSCHHQSLVCEVYHKDFGEMYGFYCIDCKVRWSITSLQMWDLVYNDIVKFNGERENL
jgi:transcription elongation factor Elf1